MIVEIVINYRDE
ncbi:Protein of unknown function [Bacillus cereus]|nr:Protein of unknown function [Bacillus cereus]SCN30683.1 Protein of unknown function [Bacillus wiedmannii]